MGKSPSQFEETIQHQFDRLCKLALKGEKIDYIRHMEYLRKNEVMLSELSQKELDQLAIYDEYDLESYKFQVLNCTGIHISDSSAFSSITSFNISKDRFRCSFTVLRTNFIFLAISASLIPIK